MDKITASLFFFPLFEFLEQNTQTLASQGASSSDTSADLELRSTHFSEENKRSYTRKQNNKGLLILISLHFYF